MNHDDSLHGERDGRIDCPRSRSEMAEADLDELGGVGDGPLATHLRRCAACRERAARILGGGEALDRALAEKAAAGVGVEEMLRRVRAEVRAEQRPAGDSRIGVRRRWRRVAALAAAAGLAAVLLRLVGPGTDPPGAETAGPPAAPRAPMVRTDVSVEADRRFALMKTDEPTISVVWFY